MNKGMFFTALTCGAFLGAVIVSSSQKALNAVNKGRQAVMDKADEIIHKSDCDCVSELESF